MSNCGWSQNQFHLKWSQWRIIDPRPPLKRLFFSGRFTRRWFHSRDSNKWSSDDKHFLFAAERLQIPQKVPVRHKSYPCDGFCICWSDLICCCWITSYWKVRKSTNWSLNCEATSPTAEIHSSHEYEFAITRSLFRITWIKLKVRKKDWIKAIQRTSEIKRIKDTVQRSPPINMIFMPLLELRSLKSYWIAVNSI